MKNYTEFINERKKHKLTVKDNQELHDFLYHVLENMDEEPSLLRAAYARIQGILNEIRKGNCPKDRLISFFQSIHLFIEGRRNADEIREWSDKLMSMDSESYDTLLQIIHEYNQLVHKYKNEDFQNQVFNVKAWLFDKDALEQVDENIKTEEDLTEEDVEELFKSGDLPWEEQQKLKVKLPTIKLSELEYDDREWKPGDILFTDKHYLVVENYEDYCDFGCGYIATYLAENPDINAEEFEEYVCAHNKADRDMGELQDISQEEIERLGKEFKKK